MDIAKNNHTIAYTLHGKLKKFSTERLHCHDTHQILMFQQGISLLLDNKKKQPLFNRMTAFIPAGCPHRSVVVGREVSYKSIYFAVKLFPSAPTGIRIFDMSELGTALLKRIELPIGGLDTEKAVNELQRDCLMLFLKILREDINQHSVLARLPVPKLDQNRVIVSYLEKHYQERIELNTISRRFSFTARHISRLFKQDLSISIFEYLKIYRILQASIQLEATTLTITEIAYASGYNSISCFFKDFNQVFSTTPKQFRKRLNPLTD